MLGRGRTKEMILSSVDIDLASGRTTAVVGESGAGKSTLARTLVGLVAPRQGRCLARRAHSAFNCQATIAHGSRAAADGVPKLDSVAQPVQTVAAILRRAVRRLGGVDAGPPTRAGKRTPSRGEPPGASSRPSVNELSGGERQRIAIARALATQPAAIILDEAVSALDVLVQAAILALLRRIQEQEGSAYLFISHDFAAVSAFADDVVVLYGGKIIERGPVDAVVKGPHHPYTEVLLRSIPGERPLEDEELRALDGPLLRGAPGCIFATRCPWHIGPVCDEIDPPAVAMTPPTNCAATTSHATSHGSSWPTLRRPARRRESAVTDGLTRLSRTCRFGIRSLLSQTSEVS